MIFLTKMLANYKLLPFVLLLTYQTHFSYCDSVDFQTHVNKFIEAFDEAYSTEVNEAVTNEVNLENEIPVEATTEEDTIKYETEPVQEVPTVPVQEVPTVAEEVFQPGSEIKHELTEEVRAIAEKAVGSISGDLRLVGVTEALSMVTDKVQRSLSLVVANKACEGDSCSYTCRVELISRNNVDEVTWHNCLDTKDNNEVTRVKRGAIGGFKQVDSEEASELSEHAIKTLDNIDADDNKRCLVEVLKAQKQLVNGIMYHLTLKMASSNSKEDDDKCEGPLDDFRICKILMQRLFSGEAPHNAQVIKSECTPISKAKEIDNNKRTKRYLEFEGSDSNMIVNHDAPKKKHNFRGHLMGGPVDQDPNSEKIREISEFVLAQLDKSSNSLNKQQIVRIVNAKSQVVSGVKYFLRLELVETNCRKGSDQKECSPTSDNAMQSCDVVVWEKSWEKFRALTKADCTPLLNEKKTRFRRHLRRDTSGSNMVSSDDTPKQKTHRRNDRLVPPIEELDPNSEKVKEMSEFALAEIDKSSNSLNKQKIVRVVHAKKQLVAGTDYIIVFELVETNCRKDSDQAVCNPRKDVVVQQCEVVVWEKPWLKFRSLTKADCKPMLRNKRGTLVGGQKSVDPNSPEVLNIARYAVSQLDAQSNSINKQKLVSVKEAKTQVVAGLNYYLKLQMVETDCRKGNAGTKKPCNAVTGSVVQECDVVVYDRPWDKHREMTTAKCSPVGQQRRLRREASPRKDVLVGGLHTTDPNDPEVQKIAEYAVSQLDAQSNSINKQKLISVKEARTQVVAGANYYLKLQLAETDCRKGDTANKECNAVTGSIVQECDVVVYDRPWDKHREMTSAKCTPVSQRRRLRREVTVQRNHLAGKHPVDRNDFDVQEIADFVVSQISGGSSHHLLYIKKAEVQTVAGYNYYLSLLIRDHSCHSGACTDDHSDSVKECDVVVYDRPWAKHRELTSANCFSVSGGDSLIPHGGRVPADKNDHQVQEMAEFAVEQLDAKTDSVYAQKLLVVKVAQKQLVAGTNYFMRLQLVQTDCHKGTKDKSGCNAAHGTPMQQCDVVVFDQPWTKRRDLTSANCTDLTSLSQSTPSPQNNYGGKQPADRSNFDVQEAAEFAVAQLASGVDPSDTKHLLYIKDAQTQMVAGKNYFLKLLLVEKNCHIYPNGSRSCTDKPGQQVQECDVVVYDRLWEKHREMTSANCFSISDEEVESSIPPGSIVPADNRGVQVQTMAVFAVEQLEERSDDEYGQKLLVVRAAQTQLVAGTNYFMRLQLVQTDCHKGTKDKSGCNAAPGTPIQQCDVVVFDQPWTKRRELTTANCNTLPGVAQSTPSPQNNYGDKRPADRNNFDVQEAAEFAVAQLSTGADASNTKQLLYIKDAQTQMVAGKNYFLKLLLVERNCQNNPDGSRSCTDKPGQQVQECDVVVYDRLWKKHREMTSANCFSISDEEVQSSILPGSIVPADNQGIEVRTMAEFAVEQLEERSDDEYGQKLLVVRVAQTQLVAGTNYFMRLQLVQTDCHKGTKDKSGCNAAPGTPIQQCDVVVFDQPWTKRRDLTTANCNTLPGISQSNTSPQEIMPVIHREDPNDSKIQEIARFAVSEMDARSNSLNAQKLIAVDEATSTKMFGTRYTIKLRAVETMCRKGFETGQECGPLPRSPVEVCSVEVHDRPWEHVKVLVSSNCSPSTEKSVLTGRHFPGGWVQQDTNSATVQDLVNFALQDYREKTDDAKYNIKLMQIVSAESQVVSRAYNYRLKVIFDYSNSTHIPSGGSNPLQCVFHVHLESATNRREVTSTRCTQLNSIYVGGSAGSLKPVDPSSPEVQEAARFSLRTIDNRNNAFFKVALLGVVAAESQIVQGTKYYIKVEVGESVCNKNQPEENCALKPNSVFHDMCEVVVWKQPWLNKTEVTECRCGIRSKRAALNKPTNLDAEHLMMFNNFKKNYNKTYADETEHKKRFRIFRANLKKIQAFQENEQGTAIYGPNIFADLTAKEFKQKYLGLKNGPSRKPSKHHMVPAEIPEIDLPTDFDWRDHNAVTPVKNQGQCGSCWAFSVTGNIEGQWFLKHGELLSFSEQELVDCDKTDNGCNGGYMTDAYEAIEKLGGLETEDEYPYDAEDEKCKFNQSLAQAQVTSSVNITTNETQIAQWLFANGPISIGINANAMQFYMGGVSHPFKFLCSKNQLDHGVLLVGFGVHRTSIRHKLLPYWLVKNSWGPHWGEKGYYRVYRGDGTCGVNQMASSAIVA